MQAEIHGQEPGEKYTNPVPSNLSKESVYDLAESIAKQLGYKPGDDLAQLVSRIGGHISYRDFWGNSDSGSLEVDNINSFRIYLAADTSPERDRFTIAHELGHYVLHFLWPNRDGQSVIKKLKANRYGSDRAEWEANWFAAAFLMPKKKFEDELKKRHQNLSEVAQIFGVSTLAAKTRTKALGLS